LIQLQYCIFSLQNLKLISEGSFQGSAVDGTMELTFDAESFKFIGHVSDASYYSQTVYNAKAQLIHPNSNLDAQWEAQYKDDSDIQALIMNGKYLTSYDREMKTASMRAEINKLRKALDMEVCIPTNDNVADLEYSVFASDHHPSAIHGPESC
jgi:hypothetical protein